MSSITVGGIRPLATATFISGTFFPVNQKSVLAHIASVFPVRHVILAVFAGFVVLLGSAGFLGILGAVLPLLGTVALTALEFLVAGLQAYVFAILTSLYLNDALHPGH